MIHTSPSLSEASLFFSPFFPLPFFHTFALFLYPFFYNTISAFSLLKSSFSSILPLSLLILRSLFLLIFSISSTLSYTTPPPPSPFFRPSHPLTSLPSFIPSFPSYVSNHFFQISCFCLLYFSFVPPSLRASLAGFLPPRVSGLPFLVHTFFLFLI